MAYHIHPVLRHLEEDCREASGIFQNYDTPGVTVIKAQEAAGERIPDQVPVDYTWEYLGSQYTAV